MIWDDDAIATQMKEQNVMYLGYQDASHIELFREIMAYCLDQEKYNGYITNRLTNKDSSYTGVKYEDTDASGKTDEEKKAEDEAAEEKTAEKIEQIEEAREKQNSTGVLGSSTASAEHTPDEIISDANSFLQAGTGTTTIDGDNVKKASNSIYNILLSIGIFLAVAVGVYLGAKFMYSTAEDKAKVKEALIPYIAGCVVIFSAFVIWKLAITILGGIF